MHKTGILLDGQYESKIIPLYYENYIYDKDTGEVSLPSIMVTEKEKNERGEEIEVNYWIYQKLSDTENIFLKDVSIGTQLYNEFHINQRETGYDVTQDKGSFFIGTVYDYSGVPLRDSQEDFVGFVFKTGLAYLPKIGLFIGAAFTAIDGIEAIVNYYNGEVKDYRDTLTNHGTLDQSLDIKHISKKGQIDAYGGLLRSAVGMLDTSDDSPILFGIHRDSYISVRYLMNQTEEENDEWQMRLAQKIQFDIVREVPDFFGYKLTTEYNDVTTNDVISQINEGEEFDLIDNEEENVYLLPEGEIKFSFIVSENGEYSFETIGNISNELEVGDIEAADKEDSLNQEIKLKLKKGEKLLITTKARGKVEDVVKYKILVTFIPNEVEVNGEEKIIHVAQGETEYVSFISDTKQAVAWDLDTEKTVGVSVAYRTIYNAGIETYKTTSNPSGAFFIENPGRYYIQISNLDTTDIDVLVHITEIQDLGYNNPLIVETAFTQIYKIHPNYSSGVNIKVDSTQLMVTGIKDSSFSDIIGGNATEQAEFNFSVYADRDYYIYIKPAVDLEYNILLKPTVTKLEMGENEGVAKSDSKELYGFGPFDTDVRVSMESNTDEIKLYDSRMQELSGTLLKKNETYYIGVSGQNETLNINVTPILSNTEGIISEDGFNIIRYIPNRSNEYVVNGAQSASWYDSQLNRVSNNLKVGNTYYVKIEGNPGEAYNITFQEILKSLRLENRQNIYPGFYKLAVENPGIYNLIVFCSKSVFVDIYDENNQIIEQNIDTSSAAFKSLNLNKGNYYFEFRTEDASKVVLTVQVAFQDNSNIQNTATRLRTATNHGVQSMSLATRRTNVQMIRQENVEDIYVSEGEKFILSGKLVCAECGNLMVGESGICRNGEIHYFYKCTNKKRNTKNCPSRAVKKEALENSVYSPIRSTLKNL